jgi:purine-nucleoside phosphorylase
VTAERGTGAESPYGAAAARRAADAVRDRLGVRAPACAVVLGSGLGALADDLEGARRVPFGAVPGFPEATVAGHAGALVAGTLAGREVVLLAGRFHLYEGHPAQLAAFPARVVHALGARTLFVSNAAGGVRRTFRPGDLMVIADHLNLMGANPLVGPAEEGDARFPDLSDPYDAPLRRRCARRPPPRACRCRKASTPGLLGPAYETPAEVRMLERLGADAVGMSTVPEVIVARASGMRVAGVSCITNQAAGIAHHALSHDEVLAVGREAAGASAPSSPSSSAASTDAARWARQDERTRGRRAIRPAAPARRAPRARAQRADWRCCGVRGSDARRDLNAWKLRESRVSDDSTAVGTSLWIWARVAVMRCSSSGCVVNIALTASGRFWRSSSSVSNMLGMPRGSMPARVLMRTPSTSASRSSSRLKRANSAPAPSWMPAAAAWLPQTLGARMHPTVSPMFAFCCCSICFTECRRTTWPISCPSTPATSLMLRARSISPRFR